MPSSRSLILTLTALAGLALAGCSIGDDGPRTTQTRDVGAFTRVDKNGSVDLRLHVGDRQRVEVRAGEKVIDDVRAEVRDGTLQISFDHDGWGGNSVVVEATVPRLTAIANSGSGDIDAEGIDASALELRSDGSADIELYGHVDRLTAELEGSGDANLSGLSADAAEVNATGSGDVDVRADEHLNVSLDGSGDVHYAGNPVLVEHVDGSGDLSRAD
jgi:hypothetical protein